MRMQKVSVSTSNLQLPPPKERGANHAVWELEIGRWELTSVYAMACYPPRAMPASRLLGLVLSFAAA